MLNSAIFSQTSKNLVVNRSDGASIFQCKPFQECHTHESDGGVSVGSLWYDSSLLAVVGDGSAPGGSSSRRLRLYNVAVDSDEPMCELDFLTPIIAVQMNRRRLVVVMETRMHVYELPYVRLLHSIDTALNARGLAVLASGDGSKLAYPQHGSTDEPDNGGVGGATADALLKPSPPIALPSSGAGSVVLFDALRLQRVSLIRAHKGGIAALAINEKGSLLATASVRGTVIRVFALPSGTLRYACRRGSYAANIRCMAFAHDAPLLCVASHTGTVHVFRVGSAPDGAEHVHSARVRRDAEQRCVVRKRHAANVGRVRAAAARVAQRAARQRKDANHCATHRRCGEQRAFFVDCERRNAALVRANETDALQAQRVEQHHAAGARRRQRNRRRRLEQCVGRCAADTAVVGLVGAAVLRIGELGAVARRQHGQAARVECCVDRVQQAHIRQLVDVHARLHDHHQPPPVHLHRNDWREKV
eukprot:TRINITY_DN3097_c0_g1_i1.p2 TRINITY_DN3097_c0_g1~~TRINITY_DN3097_c0_g1_i1.p2  ORF type:complete len:475 (-),score=237.79 TRINITY_DN3097_c0_g1_i1:328-1752(-)